MQSINIINKILRPIKNKIFLILGRGIVKAIKNDGDYQRLQLQLLKNETATNIPRFQEYGMETYPLTDAEALALFFNGNRDHGIVICVNDKRYRPDYLSSGEVVLYSLEDDESEGHRIHFKSGQIIEVKGKELNVINTTTDIKSSAAVNITTPTLTLTGNLVVTGTISSGNISATGTMSATGDVSGADFSPTSGPDYKDHYHEQGNDGNGDSEVDTSTPK